MTRRHRAAAVALNAVLAALAVFYLMAPTVYTFFSEAQLSYAHAPAWVATTLPARLTAQMFDRYNATAPRAVRFQRQLSCFLADQGATRLAGCQHEIRAGQRVHGPMLLKIASGRYVAQFDFAENAACGDGEARLQVVTVGAIGRTLADFADHISPPQHVELPFQLKTMDAALGAVEFRLEGVDRCVLLTRAGWTPPINGE